MSRRYKTVKNGRGTNTKDTPVVLGKPDRALRQDEKILGFTSDNKKWRTDKDVVLRHWKV